jgi:hypothetical protein
LVAEGTGGKEMSEGKHEGHCEGKPKILQGTEHLVILAPNGKIEKTFEIAGLQSINFNLGGHWYELRRDAYPSEDLFTLYEIVYVHSSGERDGYNGPTWEDLDAEKDGH